MLGLLILYRRWASIIRGDLLGQQLWKMVFLIGVHCSEGYVWSTSVYVLPVRVIHDERIKRSYCHTFSVSTEAIHEPAEDGSIHSCCRKVDGIMGPCHRHDSALVALQRLTRETYFHNQICFKDKMRFEKKRIRRERKRKRKKP